jgi:hypothetical protein
MKIIDPMCFEECTLMNYLVEIMMMLWVIMIIIIFIILISTAIYFLFRYIIDKIKKEI